MNKPINQNLHFAIPTLLFVACWLTFYGLGFRFEIPWDYYQLLDQVELQNRPLNSLYLLHSQPPLLNASLAVILQAASIFYIRPELLAQILFFLAGLVSTHLLFYLITALTQSHAWATLGILITIIDPAFHVFANLFFYTYWLHVLIVAKTFVCYRYFNTQHKNDLYAICIFLGMICNTRTLFHPTWAMLFLILLFSLTLWTSKTPKILLAKQYGPPTVLLLSLLVAWPLKNYAIFDAFTFSTWSGFNLSHRTGATDKTLHDYLTSGSVSAGTRKKITLLKAQKKIVHPAVIENAIKSDGARNWNHYIFVETNTSLSSSSIQWRLHRPLTWIKNAIIYYFQWSQPSYIHPYSMGIQGPESHLYKVMTVWHQHVFYFDLTPIINTLTSKSFTKKLKQNKLKINIFGLVIFPITMIFSTHLFLVHIRESNLPQSGTVFLSAFCLIWVLLVSCFSDGAESNRMRFSTNVLFTILLIKNLQHHRVTTRLKCLL